MVSLATSAGVTPAMRSTVARFANACVAWARRSPGPTSWPVESSDTSPDTYTVDPTFTACEAGEGGQGAGVDVARPDGVRPGSERPGGGSDAGGEHDDGGGSQQGDPHAMLLEVGSQDINATLYTPAQGSEFNPQNMNPART